MKEKLAQIRADALASIQKVDTAAALDALRVKYLGKKGELTAVLKQMGSLSAEERPVMGQLANEVRSALTDAISQQSKHLEELALELKLKSETVDVTIPGEPHELGHKHPITLIMDEVKDIFIGMGFSVAEGPEVELAEYNFTKLNTEEGHPGREWTDTFYITKGEEDPKNDAVLLRSQTSPMQVRTMETHEPPIRIIAPGRVYRKDEADATHSPMFHQIEGMVVDKGITMADLKGTLNAVIKQPVRRGVRHPVPSPPLPLHRALLRGGRAVLRLPRQGLLASARARAGSRCWVPAWSIPRCWQGLRHRYRCLLRLGLRHGRGASGHDALRPSTT